MSNPFPIFIIDPNRFRTSGKYKKKVLPIEPYIVPKQNRSAHGTKLLAEVQSIDKEYIKLSSDWGRREDAIRSKGIIVLLESLPGVLMQTGSWITAKTLKFELLNEIKKKNDEGETTTYQSWFIRHGFLNDFVKIFQEYLSKNKSLLSQEPRRRELVDSIEQIRIAVFTDLWTDLLPRPDDNKEGWYEIWLRAGIDNNERDAILNQFKTLAGELGIHVGQHVAILPEHTVLHVKTRFNILGQSIPVMNCIAEIRNVFDYSVSYAAEQPNTHQNPLLDSLKKRLELNGDGNLSVCILDSGIERAHPLLEQIIPEADNKTIDQAWGVKDDRKHGTPMSGLVAFGDLNQVLTIQTPVQVSFGIEGVKIVPPLEIENDDEKLAGYYTAQGVSIAEIANSRRKRVWCISTSMKDVNKGRPSEWSSKVDQLTSGVDNGGKERRLFCISAGNVFINDWGNYPQSNYSDPIDNPAQAWNGLCVGSFTAKEGLSPESRKDGYAAIAKTNTLAPNSKTSAQWEHIWPNKPDIVFEGGNGARNQSGNLRLPELDLLTTNADFNTSFFVNQNGTSFANALAAQAAAKIWLENPKFSPETIRGLMVHSAFWTREMMTSINPVDENNRPRTQKDMAEELIRTVGYGVPRIDEVLIGNKQRVYMIAEDELQPFIEGKTNSIYNEYHIYAFPWPNTILKELRENLIRMRVTLSYFIEPNPGNRVISKYRYPSCQLRFKASSPLQRLDDFKRQISSIKSEDQEDDDSHIPGSLEGWYLGPQNIFKGSVHSDWWEGTAAKLLDMKYVAVYPEAGWWKTRLREKRVNSKVKYSLIVSLEPVHGLDIDLYTEIKQQLTVKVAI